MERMTRRVRQIRMMDPRPPRGLRGLLGTFGVHRRFPPLGSVHVRVVRRYSAGFLSSVPTVTVELTAGALRRTYLLEDGLLASDAVGGSAA